MFYHRSSAETCAPPGPDFAQLQQQRDEKMRGLERARDVSEGLKLAGRSLAGLVGARIPEGEDVAFDVRADIQRLEDEVTPQERQMLASHGLQIPAGMKRSNLVKMGLIPQHFRGQEATRERESREGIARRGLESREAAAQTTATAKAQKEAKLSEKDVAELSQIDDAIVGMKGILSERQEKGYYTGPLDKIGADIGAMAGVISGESAEWRRKVTSQLNAYIKEMTGAQMSAQEAKRLLKGLPTEGDQEYIFDQKMQGTIKELERKRENFLKTRRWAGKETGAFETVPFTVTENGKTRRANVPGGDVEAFQRRYTSAVRG